MTADQDAQPASTTPPAFIPPGPFQPIIKAPSGPTPPYRSRFEEKVAAALTQAGAAYSYETRTVLWTDRGERAARRYTPDFILANGVCLEVKGYWDQWDRQKVKLVRQQRPDMDLRMVFQDASKPIRKGSKTTYGKWCDQHGIPWTQGPDIPPAWFLSQPNEALNRSPKASHEGSAKCLGISF